MGSKGFIRALSLPDIPATARLFLKIFRQCESEHAPELAGYLRELAFGSPSYSEQLGSYVHAYEDGRIGSTMISVPMQFIVHDRVVPARMLCSYMTDGDAESAGAARLMLRLRPQHQDFAFSDSASPTSRNHAVAVGGHVLPLHSLEWTRVLAPVGALATAIERRLKRRIGLTLLARPFDVLVRPLLARMSLLPRPALRVSPMTREAFIEAAPALIAHYAVRPLWSPDELGWLLDMAGQNAALGPLEVRAVHDQEGRLLGCFLYYGTRGKPAHILNILAQKGQEDQVVAAMMSDLDQAGCISVVGRAQPALMDGLALQRMISFRHKAFVCVLSRFPDLVQSAKQGDIYLGGLAGESWSRLMTDF